MTESYFFSTQPLSQLITSLTANMTNEIDGVPADRLLNTVQRAL